MRRILLIAIIVALVAAAIAGLEEKFSVSGVGSYPISQSMTSMWLAGPDHRPLLMVYFHGPEECHNTKWKVDSKVEKGKAGLAELQTEKRNPSPFDENGNRGGRESNYQGST